MDHNKPWKILKEMGIPDHLTCLLRNLYAGQEATELDMEQQTGSKQKRSMSRLYIVTLLIEYIMRNAGLDEAQAGIKIAGEISITLDMLKTPPLGQKVKN